MSKNEINLQPIAKDGEAALEELRRGSMVIARSKDDFLYILDFDGQFHMFSHTAGAPGGGQRQFPKNEKYYATVRKVVTLADAVFTAEYDKGMNIYGVMSTAEDAVLSMFPGDERSRDADVEFLPWDREKSAAEAQEAMNPEAARDGFDGSC